MISPEEGPNKVSIMRFNEGHMLACWVGKPQSLSLATFVQVWGCTIWKAPCKRMKLCKLRQTISWWIFCSYSPNQFLLQIPRLSSNEQSSTVVDEKTRRGQCEIFNEWTFVQNYIYQICAFSTNNYSFATVRWKLIKRIKANFPFVWLSGQILNVSK